MSSIRTASSLPAACAQAVTFLTRSLILRYPTSTIIAAQRALADALLPYYAASWVPADPSRGSGRRCLTLAPGCTPPRPVYAACTAARIDWADWLATLGGAELDLFVDPGRVYVRFAVDPTRTLVVWQAQKETLSPCVGQDDDEGTLLDVPSIRLTLPSPLAAAKSTAGTALKAKLLSSTRARLMRTLTVATSTTTSPSHSRASSVSSAVSDDAASLFSDSDRESVSSAATSVSSVSSLPSKRKSVRFAMSDDLSSAPAPTVTAAPMRQKQRVTTAAPVSKPSSAAPSGPYKMSRRERARQRRAGIVVTTENAAPAEYDGGRTTVLTGGVMLGGARRARA